MKLRPQKQNSGYPLAKMARPQKQNSGYPAAKMARPQKQNSGYPAALPRDNGAPGDNEPKIIEQPRSHAAEASMLDGDNSRLRLSVSSEHKVKRYDWDRQVYFWEVLSHDPADVDLTRANDGASFRDQHYGDQIGVLENCVVADKKLYVEVLFSSDNERAQLIYKDMSKKIRRNVSVCPEYTGHGRKIGEHDGLDIIAFPWRLIHVAVVPDPADPDVGIGRNNTNQEFLTRTNKKPKQTKEVSTMNEKLRARLEKVGLDPNATEDQAWEFLRKASTQRALENLDGGDGGNGGNGGQIQPRTHVTVNEPGDDDPASIERARIQEIGSLGDEFEIPREQVNQAINNGITVDVFRNQVIKKLRDNKKIDTVKSNDPKIGMNARELQKYSIVRAIGLAAAGKPLDGLELEASKATAKLRGKEAEGFYVPFDVLADPFDLGRVNAMRTAEMMNTVNSSDLISPDIKTASFIDVLRNANILGKLGVKYLSGLKGDVVIPKKTGSAQYYFIHEGEAVGQSQIKFGQLGLTPKTTGTFVEVGHRLLQQSSLDVENLVKADLAEVLSLAIQDMVIFGSGTKGQPKGLDNNKDVLSVPAGDASRNMLIDMETKVANANAATGRLAYLTNTSGRGAFKKTPITANSDKFLWGDNNSMNGYPAFATNSVKTDDGKANAYFGDWSQILIGIWAGLDLKVNPYAKDTEGAVRITALMDFDVALRMVKAFCKTAATI